MSCPRLGDAVTTVVVLQGITCAALSATFAQAGLSKIASPQTSVLWLSKLGMPFARTVVACVIGFELTVAMIVGFYPLVVLSLMLGFLVIATGLLVLSRRNGLKCGCFGAHQTQRAVLWRSVARNSLLCLFATAYLTIAIGQRTATSVGYVGVGASVTSIILAYCRWRHVFARLPARVARAGTRWQLFRAVRIGRAVPAQMVQSWSKSSKGQWVVVALAGKAVAHRMLDSDVANWVGEDEGSGVGMTVLSGEEWALANGLKDEEALAVAVDDRGVARGRGLVLDVGDLAVFARAVSEMALGASAGSRTVFGVAPAITTSGGHPASVTPRRSPHLSKARERSTSGPRPA